MDGCEIFLQFNGKMQHFFTISWVTVPFTKAGKNHCTKFCNTFELSVDNLLELVSTLQRLQYVWFFYVSLNISDISLNSHCVLLFKSTVSELQQLSASLHL